LVGACHGKLPLQKVLKLGPFKNEGIHEVTGLKFVDRKAENDSWHCHYALEFCPLADKYASEDHSSIRIIRELSRAVLRINSEGSGKGRGGQVAEAIIRYDCLRPRSNYLFSATIIISHCRFSDRENIPS
jgi:hypothetical protein